MSEVAYREGNSTNTIDTHGSYNFQSQSSQQLSKMAPVRGSFHGGMPADFGSSAQGSEASTHPSGASYFAPHVNVNNSNVYGNSHNSIPPSAEGRNRVPIPRMAPRASSRPAPSPRSTRTCANATPTTRNGCQAQPGFRSTNPQQSHARPATDMQMPIFAEAPQGGMSVNPQSTITTTQGTLTAGRRQSLSMSEALGRVNANRTSGQMANPIPMQGTRPLPQTHATQAHTSQRASSRPFSGLGMSHQEPNGFAVPPPNGASSNGTMQSAVSQQTINMWARQYAERTAGPIPSVSPQQDAQPRTPSRYPSFSYHPRIAPQDPETGQPRRTLEEDQGQSDPMRQRVDADSQQNVQPGLHQPSLGLRYPTNSSLLRPGAGQRRRASVEDQGPPKPRRRRVDGGPQQRAHRVQQTTLIRDGSSAAPPPPRHPTVAHGPSLTRDAAARLNDQRVPSPQPACLRANHDNPALRDRGESTHAKSPGPDTRQAATENPKPAIPYSGARLQSELQSILSQPDGKSHKTPHGHATATRRPAPHITLNNNPINMDHQSSFPPPGYTQVKCQVTERAKAHDAIGRADNLIPNPEPGGSYYVKRIGSDVAEWLLIKDKSTTCITNPFQRMGGLKPHPTAYQMKGYENATRGSVEMQMLARRLDKEAKEGNETSAYQLKAMIDTGRMLPPNHDRMAEVEAQGAANAAKGNDHNDEEDKKGKECDGQDEDGDGEKKDGEEIEEMGGTSPHG